MKPASTEPVLADKTVEYKCKSKIRIPDTGEKLEIRCDFDGKFEVK